MICYRLHCTLGHEFEGWFPSAESFDRQKAHGLVLCPQCGVSAVEKSLMAPALARSAEPPPIAPADQIRMALRAIRREVESRCDDVGDRFAEEALKRHDARDDGERQSDRGIYGTMSDSERERLEDEGVDFTPVPWIDRSES
ncbi:DUF1178 family protein [Asaia sp. BMEF1]|uniref:DUF1178 family protein n=1 Tax=Asaia sp. BMEF1 TaxID=3155932 RepID=UPI003F674442